MFKYYASKLNLSKPQLEAVTDCFKACFEADGSTGSEPNVDKQPDETVPSEGRKQHASFQDSTMWGASDMDRVLDKEGASARLANAMNAKPVARMKRKDEKDLFATGREVVDGSFHNIVNRQATRERVMDRQKFLNKALGINLAVDGICGPQTIAAENRYKAMLAGNQQYSNEQANAARAKYAGTPEPIRSNTNWQKQSPDNGPRYYGDAPDPRAVTATAKTNWGIRPEV